MKKPIIGLAAVALMSHVLLTGCSKGEQTDQSSQPENLTVAETIAETTAVETTTGTKAGGTITVSPSQKEPVLPQIEEVDFGTYFGDVEGSAVFFTPSSNRYEIYQKNLAEERYSPCSTFKIVSTLAALETGVITADDSMRTWSGEKFWNEKWNRDIGLKDAFQASCIWYFRTLTNEMGEDKVQAFVDKLGYGNKDISDWEGNLNKNNNNRMLTGFWVESSLKISPKEQVEVLSRIFDENSVYDKDHVTLLKEVMVVPQDITDTVIHGKTGSGKLGNVNLDSWFVGFYEAEQGTTYFAVHLNATENPKVSSTLAKEIAIQLVADR